MRLPRSLAEATLFVSLGVIFLLLFIFRPPIPYYALPLVPIALAALLYEFVGGALVSLAALAGIGALIALDPDTARRAVTLKESWPILIAFLATGPAVGWLSAREHDNERRLVSAARRLQVVQEITQAIKNSLDLDQTLRTIMTETRRIVPFERAAILLRSGNVVRVRATGGDLNPQGDLSGREFPIEETAAGWAIKHRKTWQGTPVEIQQFPDARQMCRKDDHCFIFPLQVKQAVIGAFAIGGRKLEMTGKSELLYLNQMTVTMAVAIEHARLYALEQDRARQLQAISAAGQEIASRLSLEETLRLVMEKAAETLPVDAGALLQINAETLAFHVIVSDNISNDHTTQISIPINTGVPGWVVNHRRHLAITDTAADPRVHPAIIEDGVLSVLSIPLIAREEVLGVLNLYSKTKRNAFGQDAIQLAQVFADQAAIAIENASLMDELRQGAAELEERIENRTCQLRESQAQVIRSEKLAAVGRLAASVAHEVNNPLQAITLQLQLIREENLPEEICDRLDIVGQEMQRISEIVSHLLDFQRPTAGQQDLQDVSELLDGILTLVNKQLQKQKVIVHRDCEPNLPRVRVNSGQIKQVFLNLVLNAIDAMPEGGELSIHTYQEGRSVKVSFTDNGTGMSPRHLSQLFEPFFSTKPDGSGLGLAVSHEIVTRHGGALGVTSQLGKGSTFVVNLPVPAGVPAGVPARDSL